MTGIDSGFTGETTSFGSVVRMRPGDNPELPSAPPCSLVSFIR